MMNKKAENLAFGISFLAVLASFMLIFAPIRVAAPPATFFDIFEINPPPPLKTTCENLDGECKAFCGIGEAEIGGTVEKLGCSKPNKCCKDTDTCEDFGFMPCFWTPDCQKGFVCKILTDDQVTRCCTEWKVTICHKPGTAGQKTIEVPQATLQSHLDHEDFEGPCCPEEAPVECIKGMPGKAGKPCAEGYFCDFTMGSVGATCCFPLVTPTETPVPTDTPEPTETEVPVPTDTPMPTDTPEPTETEVPVPTDTPEPTETPIPTDTPEPTQTEVPTSTPMPTGTLF